MKKSSTKSLIWLTGAVIVLGLIALAVITCQTFGYFYGQPVQQKAVWIEGFKGMQVSIMIMRLIGAICCFALLLSFLFNSIKAQNNGILFP
jgi:uncharacterized membrane protein